MKSATKTKTGALFLNLIYPGAGQLFLKSWKKGVFFIVAGSFVLAWLIWTIANFYVQLYGSLLNGWEMSDASRLYLMKMMGGLALILSFLWILSFIDIAMHKSPGQGTDINDKAP